MIRKVLIISILGLYSCSGNNIPKEVTLSEKPREIAAAYCECSQGEKHLLFKCWNEVKPLFKEGLKEVKGADRTRFLQDLMHAFVESKCFDNSLNSDEWKEVVDKLNQYVEE